MHSRFRFSTDCSRWAGLGVVPRCATPLQAREKRTSAGLVPDRVGTLQHFERLSLELHVS